MSIEELRAKRRALNREIQATNQAERRAVSAKSREDLRAEMSPERLAVEDALDKLAAKVFDNDDGRLFLEYLSDVRPVVADMIKERVSRATKPPE